MSTLRLRNSIRFDEEMMVMVEALVVAAVLVAAVFVVVLVGVAVGFSIGLGSGFRIWTITKPKSNNTKLK